MLLTESRKWCVKSVIESLSIKVYKYNKSIIIFSMLLPHWSDESALQKKSIRAGWGQGIVELATQNPHVVVLNADLPGSLKLEKFIETFPDRYFQVGVAEQNMAGIATGMAHAGKIPFITSFAAFSPGLNFSQIRLAAMSHLPLKIVGSHYGLNV